MGTKKTKELVEGVTIDDVVVNDIPEVEAVVEPTVTHLVIEEVAENRHVMATVNTQTLVRVEPKRTGLPICFVKTGTRLTVNPALSTKDFYKVSTETGIGGFCEKKFVTVK